MTDTQAPVLTGLTMPADVKVGGGDATLTYSVAASDDTAVASVWITFDRAIIGSAGPTAIWLMSPDFGEDFAQGPISRQQTISQFNTAGPVNIVDVTVYDAAGNATSYDPAALQSLGVSTGFTIADTLPDTAPPVLTGLTLPEEVDITDGTVSVSYSVAGSDDREVEAVWLTFERTASGTNPAGNRWLVFDEVGEDWDAGPITREIDIRGDTMPGEVVLYSVGVYDTAGNLTTYYRTDLEGFGYPIGFSIANANVAAGFSISAESVPGGLMLSLQRLGAPLVTPEIGLVLRISGALSGPPSATLGTSGQLEQSIENEGGAHVLRLTADLSNTAVSGVDLFDIALPLAAPQALEVSVLAIEVDGDLSYIEALPDIVAGTPAAEVLSGVGAAAALLLSGEGDDTLQGGTADDTLTGGEGADRFVIGLGGGADRITDFADGTDLLDLTAFGQAAGLDAVANAVDGPEGAEISLAGSAKLILQGISATQLGPEDTTFELGPPPADTVMEVQRLTLSGTEQVVQLAHTFNDPIAIARAPSLNNTTPVAVRITEVTPTSVRLSLQRPDYLSSLHPVEEVTLVVVEAGIHDIGASTRIEAGRVTTGPESTRVQYGLGFAETPALFSQVQTANDPDYVITRKRKGDGDGFDVFLQEEEAAADPQGRIAEEVGWMAVSPGKDQLSLGKIEAAAIERAVSDAPMAQPFQSPFAQTPELITSLASYRGYDPSVLRLSNIESTGFDVFVQEEQSLNLETTHNFEDLHYLALEQSGTVSGASYVQVGEVRSVSADDAFTTISFGAEYDNPVVFVQPLSYLGWEAAVMRIVNVTSTSATIYVQEPNSYGGGHKAETAAMLVMEAGQHTLADGRQIEVGTLQSDLLSSDGFESISFAQGFAATPIIVSQVQSRKGWDFVVTRQDKAKSSGFDITMQEEESLNGGQHATETLGWIAVDPGVGTWSGFAFEAGTTGASVDEVVRTTEFLAPFSAAPNVVAGLSSFRGADPAMIRTTGITAENFSAFVQEEISSDPETNHTFESIDYLVFGGDGPLYALAETSQVGGGPAGDIDVLDGIGGSASDLWTMT